MRSLYDNKKNFLHSLLTPRKLKGLRKFGCLGSKAPLFCSNTVRCFQAFAESFLGGRPAQQTNTHYLEGQGDLVSG